MTIIYKYENKINHKIYIGQTINLKKRIREHKNAAFNQNNPDYHLPIHRAIRKYGLENFSIEILEETSSPDIQEKYWIEYFNSYYSGYNATLGGQYGAYVGKTVVAYDLNGNFVKEYLNAKIAAEEIGVSYSTIQQVLHQQRPTCKKLQLKYKDDDRIITKFKSRQGGTIPILQIDKNDNSIIKEWDSAAQASRELNLDASSITKAAKGKLRTVGGFIWKYKEE